MLKRKEIVFDGVLAGFIFLIVLLMFVLNSCKHEPDVMPLGNSQTDNNGTESSTCNPDSIYFENQVKPLLNSNCAQSNCHNSASHKGGVILDSYSNIIATGDVKPGNPGNSDLYEVLIKSDPDDRMPPSGSLSPAQINVINKWIAQGANNNACSDLCDTGNVTFSGTIFPLMQNYCTGCHSGANASGQIWLDSYASIAASAQSGKLLGSISHNPGISPMPKGGNKLSACKIESVRIWIQNGLPN